MRSRWISAAIALPLALALSCPLTGVDAKSSMRHGMPPVPKDVDWPIYGGQSANDHYSSLTQINRSNVNRLQVAWKFDTHETGGLQTSPIIVDIPFSLTRLRSKLLRSTQRLGSCYGPLTQASKARSHHAV
jgi:glucose dehydrogenase